MKQEDYNQEYDVFETPNNLWSNIESKLDAPAKKRKIAWWSAAGSVAAACLLTFLLIDQSEDATPRESSESREVLADASEFKSKKSEATENTPNMQTQKDTDSQMQAGEYSFNKVEPLTYKNGTGKKVKVMMVAYDQSNTSSRTYNWVYGDAVGNSNGGLKPNILADPFSGGGIMGGDAGTGLSGNVRRKDQIDPSHGSTYDAIQENTFISTADEAQSTFSIDVDGASYSDVRGMIQRGVLPNPNAVRIEELINYFPYNYEEPKGDHPFSFHTDVIGCPWNAEHRLMKIGIKGESIEKEALPPNNLVFLLDVSGSMTSDEKLGLIKKGFHLLVQEMREQDRVAICVYAGAAGVVLEPTSGANKDKIMDAINRLESGGSTAGGQGIELAYATAQKHFNPKGNNRVILATDGDFNVGVSGDDALVKLIEKKRESGVALTVLGVGHDNFQSSKMEKLANNGNGNFSYIDNILEAKKVLVTEMGATLKTIAKDVKLQLDFNPEEVASYRLIGYENRLLANEDFNNDAVDAGELGAGHTVTAVYEIIPASKGNAKVEKKGTLEKIVDVITGKQFNKNELAVLKFRYKEPQGTESQLVTTRIDKNVTSTSTDLYFISAVIEYGLLLRNSEYKGTANFERILKNARLGLGRDPYGYRSEFIQIVQKTQRLSNGD